MRKLLFHAALASALACGKTTTIQNVPPALSISPSALHFALTAFGASAQQSVQLQAASAADIQVTLTLSGTNASVFSISPSGATTVPGSTTVPVVVTYAPPLPSPIPDAGPVSASAVLTITSSDPKNPSTAVALSGSAEAPELDLCWDQSTQTSLCLSQGPLTVDFGTLDAGATGGPVELDLKNLAAGVPLTVSALKLDAAAIAAGYQIVETVPSPLVLSAGSGLSQLFHVTLNPTGSGAALGHLDVTSDDPREDGGLASALLTAQVGAFAPPTACLGIAEIDYVDGHSATVDPAEALAAQPSIVPPGPLDTVLLTAEVSPSCSLDPQGQPLTFAFQLTTPQGSTASLTTVAGHPEERRLLFDVAGSYGITTTATDTSALSASASLGLLVAPQDDLSADLTWPNQGQADLDLHLVRSLGGGTMAALQALIDDAQNDCFWCNCLLASNYTNGSPCNASGGPQYPVSLQWGPLTSALAGNPLLVATQRFEPLPSEDLDVVRLTGPQAGATYGLFVHYYQAYQSAPGTCGSDQDCTTQGFGTCWGGECLPSATANLRIYVGGQDLFDGGPALSHALSQPCDLWYAGEITWLGGGHLADGGYVTPSFTFAAGDAGLTNDSSGPAGLVCGSF